MIGSLIAFVGNLASIWRFSAPEHRNAVLRTYIRIRCKYCLALLFRRKPQQERIFGFTVHFFEYSTFVLLFEEIFVTDVYYFDAGVSSPVILDCGSNIGMSVLYFKWLYPQAKIVAFEPDPRLFAMLSRNVGENRLQGVELVNKALAAEAGKVAFYFNPRMAGSTVNSLVRESLREPEATEVEATRLSEHVCAAVDFLKMDIEGVEDLVLTELARSGKLPQVSQMAVEYHHHIRPEDDQFSAVLGLLERAGFGYQLQASLRTPFRKAEFQAMFLYAYHKDGR